ncbi:MAG: hypothetical protein IJ955_08700 [Oscillospiraceae bacterium]|nr:hypothetical protein [Oscillospiraceae bacterium]
MGKIWALMNTMLGKKNGVASLDENERNAQEPKFHASEHRGNGADPLTPVMIGAKPNKNLLRNVYFVNPVNQRGQTEYSVSGVTIDGWKIVHKTAAVTLGEDGIVFTDSTPGYLSWSQRLEDHPREYIGRQLTLSCLVSDVVGTARLYLIFSDDNENRVYVNFSQPGLHTITATVPENAEYLRVAFSTRSGFESATIKAVKLEVGDTQTLAHQENSGAWVLNEIPDYAEELRRCQRYFFKLEACGETAIAPVIVYKNNTEAEVLLNLPVTMRVTPTVVDYGGSEDAFYASVIDGDGSAIYPCTFAGVTGFCENGVFLSLNLGSTPDKTSSGLLMADDGGKFALDAEL